MRYLTVLHLAGHWIAHSLPCEEAPFWPEEKYLLVSREIHETIAQLITYWVVDSVGGDLKKTFDKLTSKLSIDYLKFKDFLGFEKRIIITSIKKLRNMDKPIAMDEWRNLLNSLENQGKVR